MIVQSLYHKLKLMLKLILSKALFNFRTIDLLFQTALMNTLSARMNCFTINPLHFSALVSTLIICTPSTVKTEQDGGSERGRKNYEIKLIYIPRDGRIFRDAEMLYLHTN